MTSDFEKIKAFLLGHIPERKRPVLREARDFFGGTLVKCLGAYILIMGITFIELFLGLTLLRIPYAPLIALLITIVDILPILGTGSILIPWALIALIDGNYGISAGLLLLYLVITIIRNIIEPKLVGRQFLLGGVQQPHYSSWYSTQFWRLHIIRYSPLSETIPNFV